MTRNKTERNYSPSASTITNTSFNDDIFANLPDLSNLKDSEKQHILNVLGRDENLRSKHLSRFMQLRKDVNDLEQQIQPKSSSACARCHTEFGFLFNTGATCPKCSERVCKQCRLLYNVNDSGWLCQLCCKQMQLLSYSGEWIYSSRSNLRKDSLTTSEIIRKSLVPSVSVLNLHEISSSDTETEDTIDLSSKINSSHQSNKPNQTIRNSTVERMIVPTITDEEKLKSLKRNVQKRPVSVSSTRHISQQPHEYVPTNVIRAGSSDDLDSLFDQSINYTHRTSSSSVFLNANDKYRDLTSSTPKRILSLSKLNNQNDEINNNHIKRRSVDCESVTSSEWGADSERGESIVQRPETSKTHDSKQSLSSRMHLGGSIQSLRDTVNRIQRLHLSASRTSINSQKKPTPDVLDTVSLSKRDEQKSNSELSNTTSLKVPDEQNKTNSCTKLSTISNSKSNNSIHESSSTLTAKEPIQTEESINDGTQSTNNAYRYSKTNNNKPTKGETFGSVGNLGTIDSNDDDDDDDIDGKFEKAKLGLGNRTTSCMDIRGSQASINSTFSEKKARYGLDISGTIELKLTYTLTTGALDVTIQKCSNLAKAKRGQSSDPYVKLYLLPDRSKNGKRRTLTKKNTVDPVYDQKFRYHVTKQEFETRVLWISVWSESILGLNDFLGEINLPLTGCTLDKSEEHSLLAQKKKTDLKPILEPTLGPAEITFQITFIENPRNKDIGTLQIHYIQAKAIFFGKNSPDVFCKGLLMPDKVKKKIAGTRKGPAPKWDVPLRWDGVRCDNLENTSIEISVWCQESFRKTMFGFVRLNLSTGHFSNKPVEWLDATRFEKAAWERFIARPTMPHTITLPLRPPTARSK